MPSNSTRLAAPEPGTRLCTYCSKPFKLRGIKSHETSCLQKLEARRLDQQYDLEVEQERAERHASTSREISGDRGERRQENRGTSRHRKSKARAQYTSELHQSHLDEIDPPTAEPPMAIPENDHPHSAAPWKDDFKTEYHPSSGHATKIEHFEDFRRTKPDNTNRVLPEDDPLFPFECRGDFEFAEIALEAHLNKRQAESLIKLINHVAAHGKSAFTLSNYASLEHREIYDEMTNLDLALK